MSPAEKESVGRVPWLCTEIDAAFSPLYDNPQVPKEELAAAINKTKELIGKLRRDHIEVIQLLTITERYLYKMEQK